MSVKDDSAIRVPIEIKTEDIAEIQDLIQKLSEAEGDISRIKSTGITSGASPQTFGGQARRAGGERVTTEGRGGIFDKQGGDDALPMSFKDRTGRQAYKRENQFKALQDQVKDMQEDQQQAFGGMLDQVIGMAGGYVPFFAMNKLTGSPLIRNKINKLKQMQANAANAAGTAAGAGMLGKIKSGGARAAGLVSRVATAATTAGPIGLIIAGIMAAFMVSTEYLKWLQGPGGFWDIRYRRNIQKEMDPFFDRKYKQEINVGQRVVRVTSSPAVRGQDQMHSTYGAVKKGIPIYNGEFEAYSKGLYLGGTP